MQGGTRVTSDHISVLEFSSLSLIEGSLFVFVLQWTSTHFILSLKVFREPHCVGWMGTFLPEEVPPLI